MPGDMTRNGEEGTNQMGRRFAATIAPSPDSMRDYAPTVGVAFNMIGIHLNMHAAQLAVLRRKLGKPVLI